MSLLKKIQTELKAWQEHNFPGREAVQPLLGMGEEVGEINHAFLKRMQKIRVGEDHKAAIEDGVADLFIFTLDFCNAEGIDAEEALEKTWESVRQRDWKKYPTDGKSH